MKDLSYYLQAEEMLLMGKRQKRDLLPLPESLPTFSLRTGGLHLYMSFLYWSAQFCPPRECPNPWILNKDDKLWGRTVRHLYSQKAALKGESSMGGDRGGRCDLSNEEDILSMFSAVRSQHSGVDICINNAGLARPDTLLSGSTSGWKDMFNVNVLALSICTREAYQSMKERNVDDGHIININSASLQAWWKHSSPSNSMTRTLREQLLPMNASSVSNLKMWLRLSSTSSAVPLMSRLETSR
ncbi:dehydrogenase/reductase SDR family member 11 isoform X2 [Fukomys damarensis]|uniref:dehydrogenase/reductase SDR family member 11 isoform X2 n=1 Tax=Fukomys damarensis TaxID=885580 RepID=UPI00053FF24A|nr:dehydrogenase/reductase SDR family member 11 isoform X2 [Fukomys damarensis]